MLLFNLLTSFFKLLIYCMVISRLPLILFPKFCPCFLNLSSKAFLISFVIRSSSRSIPVSSVIFSNDWFVACDYSDRNKIMFVDKGETPCITMDFGDKKWMVYAIKCFGKVNQGSTEFIASEDSFLKRESCKEFAVYSWVKIFPCG